MLEFNKSANVFPQGMNIVYGKGLDGVVCHNDIDAYVNPNETIACVGYEANWTAAQAEAEKEQKAAEAAEAQAKREALMKMLYKRYLPVAILVASILAVLCLGLLCHTPLGKVGARCLEVLHNWIEEASEPLLSSCVWCRDACVNERQKLREKRKRRKQRRLERQRLRNGEQVLKQPLKDGSYKGLESSDSSGSSSDEDSSSELARPEQGERARAAVAEVAAAVASQREAAAAAAAASQREVALQREMELPPFPGGPGGEVPAAAAEQQEQPWPAAWGPDFVEEQQAAPVQPTSPSSDEPRYHVRGRGVPSQYSPMNTNQSMLAMQQGFGSMPQSAPPLSSSQDASRARVPFPVANVANQRPQTQQQVQRQQYPPGFAAPGSAPIPLGNFNV